MIVSAHAFLILLTPLLVQGAHDVISSSGNSPESPPPSPPEFAETILCFPLRDMTITGGVSPRPIVSLVREHRARSELDVTPKDRAEDYCLLPPGTQYTKSGKVYGGRFPVPGSKTVKLESDAIATTSRVTKGVPVIIILLPAGTVVRISVDPIISLPAKQGRARIIEPHEDGEVTTHCKAIFDKAKRENGIADPQDKKILELRARHMRRCRDDNLWRVGYGFHDVAVEFTWSSDYSKIAPPRL